MNATDFFKKIKAPRNTAVRKHAWKQLFVLRPDYRRMSAGMWRETIEIEPVTSTLYTQTNLEHINDHIKNAAPYIAKWKKSQAKYRKSAEYRVLKRKAEILALAAEADIRSGTIGSDTHSVDVIDIIHQPKQLEKYHASGKYLAIVTDERTRKYANSCTWGPSTRTDVFLIGENENGNAFAHQLPNKIGTVKAAYAWIWGEAKVEQRQGDIGLSPSSLKHVEGEYVDIDVVGHSRHRFIGEVYVNGSMHVRNGFLYHTGEQHPTIYVDSTWRRIVVGRRSQIGMSSAD